MIPYDVENIPKNPKEFALFAIGPYYKHPEQCGYIMNGCVYKTPDGRRCVAGRFFKQENLDLDGSLRILFDLQGKKQKDLFIPEVVDILTDAQWVTLQSIHDNIAVSKYRARELTPLIQELKLFTQEELEAYAAALPE